MKKIYFLLFLLVSRVWAVEDLVDEVGLPAEKNVVAAAELVFEEEILPEIVVEKFTKLGEKTFFVASRTKLLPLSEFGRANFAWNFGDGSRTQWGQSIFHEYKRPGTYRVKLVVKQGQKRALTIGEVTIYEKKGVIISDQVLGDQIVAEAGKEGLWLENIFFEKAGAQISAEEDFIRRLQEKFDFIRDAELLIFYTESLHGFKSFAQFWGKVSEEEKFDLTGKFFVRIEEGSFTWAAKIIQPIFSVLQPKFILLTRPEALNPIFENFTNVTKNLQERAIEFWIIDKQSGKPSWFLPFSLLMNYFVSNGIPQSLIYLLLATPFLTFVIAFFRQFVGVSTFGVFAPLTLALSFMVLGLKFGLLVFFVILVVSSLLRFLFEKVELLYIPKVSLLLGFVVLSFFLVFFLSIHFETSLNLKVAIFPMLVMVSLSEKFIASQSEKGIRSAVFAMFETVFVALVGFFLVSWRVLEDLISTFPEVILVPMLATFWLGKFTGLRLSEYIKFRGFLAEEEQEE